MKSNVNYVLLFVLMVVVACATWFACGVITTTNEFNAKEKALLNTPIETNGLNCEGTVHLSYSSSLGAVRDLATVEIPLTVTYSYDHAFDNGSGVPVAVYQIAYEGKFNDATFDGIISAEKQSAEIVYRNSLHAGYPGMAISWYIRSHASWQPDSISDSYSALLANKLRALINAPQQYEEPYTMWRTDQPALSAADLCKSSNVDMFITAYYTGADNGNWKINDDGTAISISDGQSSATIAVPPIYYFLSNVGFLQPRLKENMEEGDPMTVPNPIGTFTIFYGSPTAAYLRNTVNALPCKAVFKTDGDSTFGVFYK